MRKGYKKTDDIKKYYLNVRLTESDQQRLLALQEELGLIKTDVVTLALEILQEYVEENK